jgi:hypothetical protein
LAAVLVEPTTLCGVVSHERPVNSLAPLAKLVGTVLLLSRGSRGPTVWPSEIREL